MSLIAGLTAIMGTFIGAAINGFFSLSLEQKEFESGLIMRALESDNPQQRRDFHESLVDTNLIKSADVAFGLKQYYGGGSTKVPPQTNAIEFGSNCDSNEICSVNIDNLNPLHISFPYMVGEFAVSVCNSKGKCTGEIASILCEADRCSASIGSVNVKKDRIMYSTSGYITGNDSVRIYKVTKGLIRNNKYN